MLLVPSVLEVKLSVILGFCEYFPRKDVFYVNERVLFRARVYRVDFTEPTCARLM